jgi:spore germination cell wall hydrolase CwlJ-like protein
MKLILKTSILTFVFCFTFFILPLIENPPQVAVAFPIFVDNKNTVKKIKPTPINEYKFTKKQRKEIDCLATNIYHEAKGEGDIGWLAVGMVTMNRVQAKRWPNAVCKVVYQNNGRVYQFSWAGTKKRLTEPQEELYNEIYELSILIYLNHNNMHDVTDGAVFFHADYVKPFWSKKKKRTVKIGRHIFYTL